MYRIKLASGEEAVYRSTEELALAVTSGVVTADAEVFHTTANRWLPVNIHPDYRAVVTGKGPTIVADPLDPESPDPIHADAPARSPFEGLDLAVPTPPFSPAADIEYDPAQDPTPILSPVGTNISTQPSPATRLRLILGLAMGMAGLGAVGAGAFATSRYVLPWLEQHRPHSSLREGMPPDPRPGNPTTSPKRIPLNPPGVDTFPTHYPAPGPPLGPAPAHGLRTDSTSVARTSRLPATRNRTPGYFEAYADARAEMDEALEYINFQQVFAPPRFAAPESLRATRRMLSAAGNILRIYRGREVMMEQTYRPDDPGGRGSFREPFGTAEATRSLLADSDSLFGVLVGQQGRFSYDGESVRFQDPEAARIYATLRQEVVSALAVWRDSTAALDQVTMPRLLRGFEGASPPPTRQ
jgi:hypothetical protein